jgi:hypothetical protein
VASYPERIISLESNKKWHWIALVATAVTLVALGAWSAWLTVTLHRTVRDLQAVKQRAADGGLGGIVAQLQEPKSSEQLAAILAIIASEVRYDRAGDRPPKLANLIKLSSAVKQVAMKSPEIPEVWQAAFQLVSYRSESTRPLAPIHLPNCADDLTLLQQLSTAPPRAQESKFTVNLSSCALNLDDDGSFAQTALGKFFEETRKRSPGDESTIHIFSGTITYSGGKVLPADRIDFENCLFDFKTPQTPPPSSGKSLADQLLTADLHKGSVYLSLGS